MRDAICSAESGTAVSRSAATRFSRRSSLADTEVLSRTGASQRGDELLDPLVVRLERVLAEHGALRLVVELQVHPVDRVVALALLGAADELAAQAGPRGLGRTL